MEIDLKKCVGCGNCVPYCTMGVIHVENEKAVVNEDECVECNTCYRTCTSEGLNPHLIRMIRKCFKLLRLRHDAPMDVCPTGALSPPELTWPRILRNTFSDPTVTHDSTGIAGRGTMEIKTNDVTGRIGENEVGLVIDMGRPGSGIFFSEINLVSEALAKLPVTFEKDNPLTVLMKDVDHGTLNPEIYNEKVLSAIIELKLALPDLTRVLQTLKTLSSELSTVMSVGVASKISTDQTIPHVIALSGSEFTFSLNGKTNLGLGRKFKSTEVSS